MKKLLIIFGIILSVALNAQIPGTPDANGTITAGPPYEATGISTGGGEMELQLNYLDSRIDSVHVNEEIHMFVYFGDSTISKSYTTSWAHLTNAIDSMFIQTELDGFTMSGDTISITSGGDYDFLANFTHDGDNGETVSTRFYNVTQTTGIPVAGAQTMRGANNFGSTSIIAYSEIDAGDKIVVQYKGDGSGTAVYKNGVIRITRVHE